MLMVQANVTVPKISVLCHASQGAGNYAMAGRTWDPRFVYAWSNSRSSIMGPSQAADVLTIYDWHGNYGHPDHVQVHRVGVRAAELAGTPRVFEATMNRDHIRRLWGQAQDSGAAIGSPGEEDFDPDGPADDGNPFGMEEAALTHAVDVSAFIERKREAVRCHASQVTDTSFFLQMPTELFTLVFGTEWFIERGVPAALREGWLLD